MSLIATVVVPEVSINAPPAVTALTEVTVRFAGNVSVTVAGPKPGSLASKLNGPALNTVMM